MAEELSFEERLRDGGAVDGDERPLPAPSRLVDDPRGQLLARAALAGNKDGGVRVADLLEHGPDASDRRRLAHERAPRPGISLGDIERGSTRDAVPPEEVEKRRQRQGQELQVAPVEGPSPAVAGQVDEAGGTSPKGPGVRQDAPGMSVAAELEVGEEGLRDEIRDEDGAADLEGAARDSLVDFRRDLGLARTARDAPRGLEGRISLPVEHSEQGPVRSHLVKDDLGDPGEQAMRHGLLRDPCPCLTITTLGEVRFSHSCVCPRESPSLDYSRIEAALRCEARGVKLYSVVLRTPRTKQMGPDRFARRVKTPYKK